MPCFGPTFPYDEETECIQYVLRSPLLKNDLIKEFNDVKYNENPTRLLCKICKVLSKDQMTIIFTKSFYLKFETLLDWYKDHLEKDIKNNTDENELKIARDELERIK